MIQPMLIKYTQFSLNVIAMEWHDQLLKQLFVTLIES